MKVYIDLSKKALKSVDLESQTVYTGDLVTTLEVISTTQATNEYVMLSAKLPNSREVGPYLYDDLRIDDTTNNTSTWKFTLSKENGFTLVAGNTTFYVWLIKEDIRKCLGAVNVNVEHATSTGDYSYFVNVGYDVDETLTNMDVKISQCMDAVAIANTAISTLGTSKVDKETPDGTGKIINTDSNTKIEKNLTIFLSVYKATQEFLGDVIRSIVTSETTNAKTEIDQETNGIIFTVTNPTENRSFSLSINETRLAIVDSAYSDSLPAFLVNNSGVYFHGEKLLTSVNTNDIVDRAVTMAKIAYSAVGTNQLANNAVTNVKLANNAVDTANVKDKAITRAKLSAELQQFLEDLVISIPDNSVTTQKIVDGAVSLSKLSPEIRAIISSSMVFKGTLGSGGTTTTLPPASPSNTGNTYKVIAAGIYRNVYCDVGDLVVSNGSTWVLIPSGDDSQDEYIVNVHASYNEQTGKYEYSIVGTPDFPFLVDDETRVSNVKEVLDGIKVLLYIDTETNATAGEAWDVVELTLTRFNHADDGSSTEAYFTGNWIENTFQGVPKKLYQFEICYEQLGVSDGDPSMVDQTTYLTYSEKDLTGPIEVIDGVPCITFEE